DGALRGDAGLAGDYRQRLETLVVERDGQRLLPELYYVPAERVAREKAEPGSQARLPNDNVPLVWAQSLYLLGVLLQEGLLEADDLDPLGRRLRVGRQRAVRVQVALLAEDETVRERLRGLGIDSRTLADPGPAQVQPASRLAQVLDGLGRNPALGLSGRPEERRPGTLITSQVFTLAEGQTCVFLPSFMARRDFYLQLDNHLLAARVEQELAYLDRHWDRAGQPLLALLITDAMLRATDHQALLALIRRLWTGTVNGVAVEVAELAQLLPAAARAPLKSLPQGRPEEPLPPEPGSAAAKLSWGWQRPLPFGAAADWSREPETGRLLTALAASDNPRAQIELLGLLWARLGPESEAFDGVTVRQLTELTYGRACRDRAWGVIRRAAGLLGKSDDNLADAVADIVVRQHQLSVGRAYSDAAVLNRPLDNPEILERIRAYGGDDYRAHVLLQEIVLFLGWLIKADPARLKGTLTLRAWHLLLLLTASLARERGLSQGEAFDALLELSPHALLGRLHRIVVDGVAGQGDLTRLESLHREGGARDLQRMRYSSDDDPRRVGAGSWSSWRERSGILTRLPEDFHPRVWTLLRHCRGLIIGDRLDARNRLDSATLLADTTPAERSFALYIEHLLNGIHAPEYRQLCIETLLVLADIALLNPDLQVEGDVVLDVVIGTAVRLNWYGTNPEGDDEAYNEHRAEAWQAFYASPPHQVANAVMAAVETLLAASDREIGAAA
ncbi:MAG: glycoside hydrolase family 15 protein, partial [Candidatus Competibacterales bacterium]|nr:glycoside hydrolase family 15 protein [Candidatus Competibacterales bacterium]